MLHQIQLVIGILRKAFFVNGIKLRIFSEHFRKKGFFTVVFAGFDAIIVSFNFFYIIRYFYFFKGL